MPFAKNLFTLLALLSSAFTFAEANKPNVVLIVADDLGYGDLSSYGQTAYDTPEIDRIGAEGTLATDYHVVVPYCAPSRASMLTGRFPLRHGMIRNPHPDTTPEADAVGIPDEERTLGEVYQAAGYQTSLVGKWHLGHQAQFLPTRNGFDSYYGILYSNDMLPIQTMVNETVDENPIDQRNLTKKYTDRAVEFIDENKDSLFFLYLAHSMPHKPLAVSKKFYTPETPDDLYADVIRELDWSVGEVMKTLEKHDILDNTIVIFTSDNGPHFGGSTGGFKGKKATPWEGGLRVPFLIRYPKAFPKGTVVDTPFWSLDLFETLLDLSGIEIPIDRKLDGENAVALLKGETKKHAPIFSSHGEKVITIRDGDWKLYLNEPNYLSARDRDPDWVDPRWPNGTTILAQAEQPKTTQYPGIPPERFENPLPLFNLARDPAEMTDLAKEYPEVVSRLRKKYERFLASMPELN
ncbi:sulfatase-like hydrolase/transferase [Pelagicoccus mobilis]|uniref:Sulfatase-like hydrolase/transferase n=1 Tax=Pelagicoccus mobilis TaxID=415221 RepID=A0A934S4U7_9BACT|nr:sulfatase-like hydrolase/transferase [Pelagicoccus mobilis]MBK1879018.1 sulfatase-like hydrolase/transferase [Pelagicoccus mobilis]